MRRIAAVLGGVFLVLAVVTGSAVAHHDGEGNLPEDNPHAAGVPQFAWEAGTDALIILDEEGNLTGVPVVLDFEPQDFENGNLWFLLRIGDGDDAQYVASRFEGFLPTGDVLWMDNGDFTFDNFANAATGEPVTADDYAYAEEFPHGHHLVLNVGTDREKCVDLANGRALNHPNQHNSVHIGAPGQHTSADSPIPVMKSVSLPVPMCTTSELTDHAARGAFLAACRQLRRRQYLHVVSTAHADSKCLKLPNRCPTLTQGVRPWWRGTRH